MGKKKEMIGIRFGRLIARQQVGKNNTGFVYLFDCDCGNEYVGSGYFVRSGHTKSCGCLRSEVISAKNFVHGKTDTPEYRSMQARISNMKRKKRMPKWADKEAIKNFYLNKPHGYQVDHIIPLCGQNVSGLHVESNLQYLLPEENRQKSNHYSLAR